MNELEAKLSQFEESEELFPAIGILDQLMEADPENLDYRFRLGVICARVGQVERAETLLRECIAAGMDTPVAHLNLGHALKAMGKKDEAVECYRLVADSEDDSQAAIGYWSLANLKDYRFDDLVIARLRGRAQSEEIQPAYRGLLLFALAAAWEQKKRYDNAFMAMSEANLLIGSLRPFRGNLYGQFVSSMMKEFTAPVKLPALDGPTPIFVLGMPRSGTTLVEQILASHSDVEATDELPFLNRMGLEMEMRGGYAKRLALFDEAQQKAAAKHYMDRTIPYRKQGLGHFIDKNPGNFMHIGLIKTLFPNAKIINLVRDPLDNAIGVYKMYFNKGLEYSYSLDGIIYYWQGYLTLMKHWEELYPGEIMHLSYEALAHDPDKKITEILEYCELPVEEACFRFYESDRPVLTPSAGQVRSPISTKSIGSGLKYANYIKPSVLKLAEIKHKAIEIFGIEKILTTD